jgi:hypothetical protein
VPPRYKPAYLFEYTNFPFQPNDVLKLHHERNSHPRLPNPALLELLCAAEIYTSNSKAKWKQKWKQKPKAVVGSKSEDELPKATQLGWYSPRWKSFLKDAKVECHTQQALENHFPSLVDDLPVAITESLSASLVQWLKNGVKVVLKGYRIQRASASARTLCPFPEYSPIFQNTTCIISEDPDGYGSVSEGLDDYRMVSRYRDK